MNNAANTIHWKKGDLVIHDADEKADHMLMRVIGYTRDGLCKTRYVDTSRNPRKIYTNPIAVLHDPNRPDIRARWAGSAKSSPPEKINIVSFELMVIAQLDPARFTGDDGKANIAAIFEWLKTDAGKAAKVELDRQIQAGYPEPWRDSWGDRHPCRLCGKFGYTAIGNAALCREHADWWAAEEAKFKPGAADSEGVE